MPAAHMCAAAIACRTDLNDKRLTVEHMVLAMAEVRAGWQAGALMVSVFYEHCSRWFVIFRIPTSPTLTI